MWKAPTEPHQRRRNLHLRRLIASDPLRGERLSVEAADLQLDYPTNRLTDETIALLVQLAGECRPVESIDAMSSSATNNVAERS
ncbi:hypothetical protein PQR65_38880 [Paraburkholderia nemoris]|uniref:hypothetical protein n=1 Tax=Paraburkholderia nemoris TaxID=2793076 RepID=UPI0038BAD250